MNHRTLSAHELRETVRLCLLHDWDPIGVREIPEAANEYDSYVGGVCSLLARSVDAFKLRGHLARIETDAMGLSSPCSHLNDVVEKLLALVTD